MSPAQQPPLSAWADEGQGNELFRSSDGFQSARWHLPPEPYTIGPRGRRASCIRSGFVEPNHVNQCPLHTPSPIVNLSNASGSEWGGGPSPWSERRGGSWHLRHTASGGGPGPEAGTHPQSPHWGGRVGGWVLLLPRQGEGTGHTPPLLGGWGQVTPAKAARVPS